MSAFSGQQHRKLNVYGKTGPYGELLWYLLGSVKTRFINDWLTKWGDDHGRLVSSLRAALPPRIRSARRELRAGQGAWIEGLVEAWPSEDETPAACRRRLATKRWSQLDVFLRECEQEATLIPAADRATEQARRQLELDAVTSAISRLVWPYYFIRYNDGDDKRITWCPSGEMLQLDMVEITGRATSRKQLLYPSLGQLWTNQSEKDTRDLAERFEAWADHGELDISKSGDIGFVQPFDSARDGYIDLSAQPHRRSRFADMFYLNQEAHCWLDCGVTGQDPRGAFYWCSPVKGLLYALATMFNTPSPRVGRSVLAAPNPETARESLDQLTEAAWRACNGPVVGERIRRRYDVTQREIIEKADDAVSRAERRAALEVSAAMGVLYHEMKNFVRNRRENDTLVRTAAIDTCVVLVLQAATALQYTDEERTHSRWQDMFVTPSYQQASLGELLRGVFDEYVDWSFDFSLDDSSVNKLLPAVIFELARNIDKHNNREAPQGKIWLEQKDSLVRVCAISSCHSFKVFRRIYGLLPQQPQEMPQHGVSVIIRLLSAMKPTSNPVAEWQFLPSTRPGATASIEPAHGAWRLVVPAGAEAFVRGEDNSQPPEHEALGSVVFRSAFLRGAVGSSRAI